jgi:hypothetical protein
LENKVLPRGVHDCAKGSEEDANVLTDPEPAANHFSPFQATDNPEPSNTEVPSPVHVLPSKLVAIVFVPDPIAIQVDPFVATELQPVEKMVLPNPVHVFPS